MCFNWCWPFTEYEVEDDEKGREKCQITHKHTHTRRRYRHRGRYYSTACPPLSTIGPRYIGPVEMTMAIAAPPRVRTSNLKSQAPSEAPGFTHLFLLLQGCLASTVQPTLSGAAVSRPRSKGLLVYGLPGLPESHPHHLSIVDLPLEDVDVPSGMASSSWATKEGQSLSTMGQLPLAVIFTRARAAAMAELQQYGSRFGPTQTGGFIQYPGGQRFLCPPQGPMWNGQQWVTNGPTKAEHIAAMKDKADTRPQELVPADPDISRMYEVQELDGNWTRRSRYTIDSKDIGQVRWYQRPDGTFFAKRLPSG
ncbi:hypothetical protein VE04_02428 [Pseudogymnoascus sp. 24MN13]|nr:hypothetical protein VE04_02428 [Pseudogymnoascus sp. 24MN13]